MYLSQFTQKNMWRNICRKKVAEISTEISSCEPSLRKRDICIFYLSLLRKVDCGMRLLIYQSRASDSHRVRWQISRHEGRLFASNCRTAAAAEVPMAGIHVFARPAADGRHCSARSTPALQCADRSIPSEFSAKTLDALRVDGHGNNHRQSKESRRGSTRNPL